MRMRIGSYKRRRVVFCLCFLSLSFCSYAWPRRRTPFTRQRTMLVRGGSSDETVAPVDPIDGFVSDAADYSQVLAEESIELSVSTREIKQRQSSDLIQDLITRSAIDGNEESLELRNLITSRMEEYLENVQDASNEKLPDPRKLLHFLAPKIPAIKHSPDVALRIQSARSDMDCGVAASLIGILAHACEVYDGQVAARAPPDERGRHEQPAVSAVVDLVNDRRFEQLIECVLCGVNVKKRQKEYLQQQLDNEACVSDIEEILDVTVDEGLNVRDACRVAWGIAVLGVNNRLVSIGGEKVTDILVVLSLRTRELLLKRLQLLRRDDLYAESGDGGLSALTLDERLEDLAEEVAEDAASAMWAFACVRACTGVTSVPLLEVCCSILCQDPLELRRRAQDAEATLEATDVNLGSNDVVDRLAESEADMSVEASSNTTASDTDSSSFCGETPSVVGKGALIDWLSPKELTDVLWALALHGSRSKENAVSKDDVDLSNTVAVMREIAFDRLVEGLRAELETLVEYDATESTPEESVVEEEPTTGDVRDEMTVEVVDAATLLASENAAMDEDFPPVVHNYAADSMGDDGNIQDISVVDAKSLLAAERELQALNTDDSVVDAESLLSVERDLEALHTDDSVVGAQSLLAAERELEALNTDDLIPSSIVLNKDVDPTFIAEDFEPTPLSVPDLHRFSQHDLCSLAWVVTELRDPLRRTVVNIISRIFLRIGTSGMVDLNGADLSNLAWALAKYLLAHTEPNYPVMLLLERVSKNSLAGLSSEVDGEVAINDIMQRFQPPELSRLLWAVASIDSYRNEVDDKIEAKEIARNLARVGLLAAASNMEIFGTEDLARIAWAFLEVADLNKVLGVPAVADALGKVLTTVETSLLLWENGSGPGTDPSDSHSSRELTRFASFFGRSRFHLSFLDHKEEESEDQDEFHFPSYILRGRLPLLRDLPIDPSTLCKTACCFAKLSGKYPGISGSETLLRIALRLLTSRSGHLLRECPRRDVIRLCEAVAVNESVFGRELIGNFVRRVVRLLNDPDKESTRAFTNVRPQDFATLIWSLGQLGVRHQPEQEDVSTAHRRLQLVQELSFLTKDRLGTLSSSRVARLLSGLVSMNVVDTDSDVVLNVLESVSTHLLLVEDGPLLCEFVESLGALKPDIDVAAKKENATSVDLELLRMTDYALDVAAERAIGYVGGLSALDLRRLLSVYSLLPHQADDLVEAIEEEVARREDMLASHESRQLGRDLLRSAASNARDVIRTLADETAEGSSALATIKHGLRSIFRSTGGRDDSTEEADETADQPIPDERLQMATERVLESIIESADYLEEADDKASVSTDEVVHRLEDGALFELGRCRILIAQYRRVDFDTGTTRSRFDQERRRDMVKDVLSRIDA